MISKSVHTSSRKEYTVQPFGCRTCSIWITVRKCAQGEIPICEISGRQHFQNFDCWAMTLLTTRTVGSVAYNLHGSSGPGISPINTFTQANADFEVDSKLYPPYRINPRSTAKGTVLLTPTPTCLPQEA